MAAPSWAPAGALFGSRWDAGDLHDGGRFDAAPWNFQSSTPTVVTSPVRAGGRALRIAFDSGGHQHPGPGAAANPNARRSELEPDLPDVSAGQTRWVRYDVLLETGFPVGTERWCVLGQFKQGPSGSPPVELVVEADRWKVVRHGSSSNVLGKTDLGPAIAGRVQQVVWGVTFGAGAAGRVGGGVDGTRAPDVATSTWNAQGPLNLKMPGIYADLALGQAFAATFDAVVVGPTYESVVGPSLPGVTDPRRRSQQLLLD